MIESLKTLGTKKLAALGGIAATLLIFFAVLIARVSKEDMTVLYRDLDPADTNQIVAQMELLRIPYRLADDGATIMVAPAQVGRTRITMAEAGLPRGGSLGYEIFDREEGFGTSNFVQRISRVRALEGELARTIMSIDQVKAAKVHLVLPERELFSRERQPASASVILKLIGSRTLPKGQVSAIQHLVASAVPELDIGSITIVDDRGNLLARGMGSDSEQMAILTAEEARENFEIKKAREITLLLENIIGPGKVQVLLSADINFDRVVTNAETFDPDGAVPRSVQTIDEQERDRQRNNAVTIENNLPDANIGGNDDGNTREFSRSEETINFEISRVVENKERFTPSLRRVSVGVLVDGIHTTAADGTKSYTPRSAAELEQIERIVQAAIGFDPNRGDRVDVTNMPFTGYDGIADLEITFWDKLDANEYIKMAETIILALIGILIILLVVRPMMRGLLENAAQNAGADGTDNLLAAAGLMPALEGPDGQTLPSLREEDDFVGEEMIDIGRIDGKLKVSSVKKIGEIIDKHPEEAVQILRRWLYEEV